MSAPTLQPPLLSICIPAYKAEAFLQETLESVRAQEYTNWELIVTEDGSKDGTENIVRRFADTVSQAVTYQRNPVNQGLPATRNNGIATARSNYIVLLDSDDLWLPTHLSDLAALIEDEDPTLIHAGSVLFDHDTGEAIENRLPSAQAIATLPLSLYQMGYIIQPSSTLLTRSAWQAAGKFDPSFRHVEDWDMWLRCARAGVRFRCTGKITCRYRRHRNALSKQGGPMALAAARALQKHLDWTAIPEKLRKQRTADTWFAAGKIHLRATPVLARDCFRQANQISCTPRTLLYSAAATLLSFLRKPTA